jgi:hypothetical protein
MKDIDTLSETFELNVILKQLVAPRRRYCIQSSTLILSPCMHITLPLKLFDVTTYHGLYK